MPAAELTEKLGLNSLRNRRVSNFYHLICLNHIEISHYHKMSFFQNLHIYQMTAEQTLVNLFHYRFDSRVLSGFKKARMLLLQKILFRSLKKFLKDTFII